MYYRRITHRDDLETPGNNMAPGPKSGISVGDGEGEETWGASLESSVKQIVSSAVSGSDNVMDEEKEKLRLIELERLTQLNIELNNEIKLKTIQLSELENNLNDEKSSNILLKQQKKSFKDMIETLKGRLVEVDKDFENLSGESVESQNKINHLTDLLREEVMKNEENGRAVECLEVKKIVF